MVWASIRDSLWFIPGLFAVAGVLLAGGLVRVTAPSPDEGFVKLWLFGGGAEGARGVLSTIAGSLITVTGVVFSVTIVALQLASSQFTPRLLRSFVADRANQMVLGVFIGTFTYTLLVLRTTRAAAPDGGDDGFVPQVAVSVAVLLLLVSIAALIFFIDHAARSVQASVILDRETRQTLAQVWRSFPDEIGEEGDEPGTTAAPDGPGAPVFATRSGYLQAIPGGGLLALAADHDIVVRVDIAVGCFVLVGRPLATIWPASRADDDLCDALRRIIVLGPERTPEQDVGYGIVEIADIAVRALSPGVNDPTTAMLCIDRLSEILAARSSRRHLADARVDENGCLRVIVQDSVFADSAALAFDQIRFYGVENPAIARKLLTTCMELASLVSPAARPALARQVDAVLFSIERSDMIPADRSALDAVARAARASTR
ncbi:MAG: DUF2254 domain-containing protein [Gemmatimonadales bacterium]|nr:DUF2254 domain-containing protein [Gemmatimonadales bacterium]